MTNARSTQGALVKATIQIAFASGSKTVKCKFNPKEYSFSRQNSWSVAEATKTDIGHLKFGSGQPATLKLQLLFDDYDDDDQAGTTSLKESTDLLWRAMRVEETKAKRREPPQCQFCWGEVWSFTAVIDSLSQKFTMFSPTGQPLRALVDISFKQVQEEDLYPKQNPTSGGGTGEHMRTVRVGETLVGIAFEEYGDSTVWRHLADINKIRNPLQLQPGQILLITPLPFM